MITIRLPYRQSPSLELGKARQALPSLAELRAEAPLLLLGALFGLLYLLQPTSIGECLVAVDWHTLKSLAAMLLIVSGIRQSHLLDLLGRRIILQLRTERSLGLALVLFTAGSAAFLTNDIALFVTVPLALCLQGLVANEISGKLIALLAIAANVGSFLTPIGNPQNLFLWHQWGISFGDLSSTCSPPGGSA